MSDFNPRTPVGCDLHLSGDYYPIYDISIHAPQWGATTMHIFNTPARVISIHAPQWGATYLAACCNNQA